MKIQITLKDPDGVSWSVDEAVKIEASKKNDPDEGVIRERIVEQLRDWIEYEEYVTIEIDTKTNKARVVPVTEV